MERNLIDEVGKLGDYDDVEVCFNHTQEIDFNKLIKRMNTHAQNGLYCTLTVSPGNHQTPVTAHISFRWNYILWEYQKPGKILWYNSHNYRGFFDWLLKEFSIEGFEFPGCNGPWGGFIVDKDLNILDTYEIHDG